MRYLVLGILFSISLIFASCGSSECDQGSVDIFGQCLPDRGYDLYGGYMDFYCYRDSFALGVNRELDEVIFYSYAYNASLPEGDKGFGGEGPYSYANENVWFRYTPPECQFDGFEDHGIRIAFENYDQLFNDSGIIDLKLSWHKDVNTTPPKDSTFISMRSM